MIPLGLSSNAPARVPTVTALGAAQRAQRHVANSLPTWHLQLPVALAIALGHCPDCSLASVCLHE